MLFDWLVTGQVVPSNPALKQTYETRQPHDWCGFRE